MLFNSHEKQHTPDSTRTTQDKPVICIIVQNEAHIPRYMYIDIVPHVEHPTDVGSYSTRKHLEDSFVYKLHVP